MAKSQVPQYDLWDDDEGQNRSKPELKKKNNRNRHHKSDYVPSLLPAVALPHEGASYNPPLDSYLDFVTKIAKQENRLDARERRMERKINQQEEISKGLESNNNIFFGKGDCAKEEDTSKLETDTKGEAAPLDNDEKDKTNKKVVKIKKKNGNRNKTKQKEMVSKEQLVKQKNHQLNSLKSLNRTICTELEEHRRKVEQRSVKRTIKKLTQRKRLGCGKFESNTEPMVMPEDLCTSLRQLTAPTGDNILQERMKSLQQRNILPIAGEAPSSKLKRRLKIKFTEKRSVKEVTSTSMVI